MPLRSDASTTRPGEDTEKKLREARALAAAREQEIARLKATVAIHEKASRVGPGDSRIALKAGLGALEEKASQQEATIKALRSEIAALQEQLSRQAAEHAEVISRLGGGTQPLSGSSASAAPRERRAIPRLTLAERVAHSRRDAETEAEMHGGEGSAPNVTAAPEAPARAGEAAASGVADAAGIDEPKEAEQERRTPRIKSRLLDRISNLSKA